jgi:hypothetical protein
MNREALIEGLVASQKKSTSYVINRLNSGVIVSDKQGRAKGEIQFDPSGESRCVIWSNHKVIAQCEFGIERGWQVYPIVDGFLASEPIKHTNPLEFLVAQHNRRVVGASA